MCVNENYDIFRFKFENNKSVKLTESKRLKISDGDIEFSPLFPDDVGQYQCKVANKGQEDLALTPLAQIFVELGGRCIYTAVHRQIDERMRVQNVKNNEFIFFMQLHHSLYPCLKI